MKNHKKILILFMFLFIYFVMPRDVLAVTGTINKTCTCTGSKISGELNLSSDVKGNNQGVEFILADNNKPEGWKNLTGNGIRPGTNKYSSQYPNNFNFAPTNANGEVRSLQCPAQIVITKANVYLYSAEQVNSKEPENFFNSLKAPNSSDLLNCQIESEKNSNVEDNNSSTNTQEWADTTTQNNDREQKRKRREQILKAKKKNEGVDLSKQSKQNCSGVFGSTSDENSVAWILQKLFNYIRIFGILLTIVFSAFDYTKAIISSDFDALKKAQKRQVYRIIGVVALLILPVLINFLLGLFISGSVTDFSCGIY